MSQYVSINLYSYSDQQQFPLSVYMMTPKWAHGQHRLKLTQVPSEFRPHSSPFSRLRSFSFPLHSSSGQTFFFFLSQRGRNKNTTVQKSPVKKTWNPIYRTTHAVAERVFWKSIPKMSLLCPEHGHRTRRGKVHFSAFVRITDPSRGRKSLKRRRSEAKWLRNVRRRNFFTAGCFIRMLRSFGDSGMRRFSPRPALSLHFTSFPPSLTPP